MSLKKKENHPESQRGRLRSSWSTQVTPTPELVRKGIQPIHVLKLLMGASRDPRDHR